MTAEEKAEKKYPFGTHAESHVRRIRAAYVEGSQDRSAELQEEIRALRAWARSAFDALNLGASMMTLEQLSGWTGVRAVIESYPDGTAARAKLEEMRK